VTEFFSLLRLECPCKLLIQLGKKKGRWS